VSSALLWRLPLYRWMLWGQIAFYALALVGALRGLKPKVLRLPFYYCWISAAWFVWLYQVMLRRKREASSGGGRRPVEWS